MRPAGTRRLGPTPAAPRRPRRSAWDLLSLVEVVTFVEVLDQPRPCGIPVQNFLREGVRGRIVERGEQRQKAELAGLLGGNAGYRQIQMAADDAGDVTERHALVGNPVQPR